MNTTDLGRLGEAKVLAELTALGYYVFTDLSGKCPVDLIIWKDGVSKTVQVKSTDSKRYTSWVVQLRSIRPNRSGNTIKLWDPSQVDYLAVYIHAENRVVLIESASITQTSALTIQENSVYAIPASLL